MLSFPPPWLVQATVPRLTLFLNHVLSSEPVAVSRLKPHAGRCVLLQWEGPPGWPPLPDLLFEVTPAGLLDWRQDVPEAGADLRIAVQAPSPWPVLSSLLQGRRPRVDVSGDAALAAEVSWLFDNLRWDAEDDLARWTGPVAARELVRVGGWLGAGLRSALEGFAKLAGRKEGSWAPSA